MKMPPLLADFTHARPCKPFCEKYLTLPSSCAVLLFYTTQEVYTKLGTVSRYALFYTSSVSLAAFIAWIVASTIFSSFSSRALSMASIRFLHSLPLFLDG